MKNIIDNPKMKQKTTSKNRRQNTHTQGPLKGGGLQLLGGLWKIHFRVSGGIVRTIPKMDLELVQECQKMKSDLTSWQAPKGVVALSDSWKPALGLLGQSWEAWCSKTFVKNAYRNTHYQNCIFSQSLLFWPVFETILAHFAPFWGARVARKSDQN